MDSGPGSAPLGRDALCSAVKTFNTGYFLLPAMSRSPAYFLGFGRPSSLCARASEGVIVPVQRRPAEDADIPSQTLRPGFRGPFQQGSGVAGQCVCVCV